MGRLPDFPITLDDGTVGSAMMTRFHHSIADGVRLTQVLLGLCETDEASVGAVVARKGVQSGEAISPPEEIGRVAMHAAGEVAQALEAGVEDMAGETVQAVRNPLSALMHLPGKALGVARSGFHQVEEGVSLVRHPDRLLDALEVLGAEQHRSLNDLSSVTKIALASTESTVWTGKPGTHKALAWSPGIPSTTSRHWDAGRERRSTTFCWPRSLEGCNGIWRRSRRSWTR